MPTTDIIRVKWTLTLGIDKRSWDPGIDPYRTKYTDCFSMDTNTYK